MKKIILILVTVLAVSVQMMAADVSYTPLGNGLELITKADWSETFYGLRKDGIVLLPPEYCVLKHEATQTLTFYRVRCKRYYVLEFKAWLEIESYDLTNAKLIVKKEVKLKNVINDPRKAYEYIPVTFESCKALKGIAYALCYDDRTGGGKNNIIIFGRVDGKLCKYVATLIPQQL